MVEEDRCRSEKVVAFQSELVDMSATVLAFETRLKEMDSVIKEALEQSKREMAAEEDEVALEARVKEKKRLEKVLPLTHVMRLVFAFCELTRLMVGG